MQSRRLAAITHLNKQRNLPENQQQVSMTVPSVRARMTKELRSAAAGIGSGRADPRRDPAARRARAVARGRLSNGPGRGAPRARGRCRRASTRAAAGMAVPSAPSTWAAALASAAGAAAAGSLTAGFISAVSVASRSVGIVRRDMVWLRQSRPARSTTSACARIICPLRSMQPQPASLEKLVLL